MSEKNGKGLPLVAARLDPSKGRHYDEFAIAHTLRERGWVVPAYTMAPHAERIKMLRVVVREDFSKSRCDSLIADIKLALTSLDKLTKEEVEKYKDHVAKNASRTGRARHKGMNKYFADEKHSLQGKHGKVSHVMAVVRVG